MLDSLAPITVFKIHYNYYMINIYNLLIPGSVPMIKNQFEPLIYFVYEDHHKIQLTSKKLPNIG